MKARNYHVYGDDALIERLAEEYVFIGRHIKVEPGHLTLLAYPPRKPSKKKEAKDEEKRAERGRRPQAPKNRE